MFRDYFFDDRTLIVAGLILVCVVVYALKHRPKGARPKYYMSGHLLFGLGMAGFYYGATEGIMNGRLKIPFSHLSERVVQVAVLPGNAATIYGIGITVAAAACITCALILLCVGTKQSVIPCGTCGQGRLKTRNPNQQS
jgi:hypothetical protein